jgi:hypothetical protein
MKATCFSAGTDFASKKLWHVLVGVVQANGPPLKEQLWLLIDARQFGNTHDCHNMCITKEGMDSLMARVLSNCSEKVC